jgi:4-azaleucine resistance transporter AzlC
MLSKSQEFWAGVRAEIPLLVGVFPFGVIYGVLALEAGLSPYEAQGMSAIIFAGSAQFIATQLIELGTPGVVIVATIFVVNLRHALYSASLAPYFEHLSFKWKGALSYLLTDEAYAVIITCLRRKGTSNCRHWFFLGAGLALWTTWQISTGVGIFFGGIFPAEWPLDFAIALTFIALLVPAMEEWSSVGAALAAGTAAVVLFDLPYRIGILVAALIGIAVGMLLERS